MGSVSKSAATPNDVGGRNSSRSLRRGLAILQWLGEDPIEQSGASLTELSEGVSLNKSTVLRLLAPLTDARLVERDQDSGRYRLGSRTAQLGHTYLERLDLRSIARRALRDLARDTGETAHLVIAELPEVVYVDKVDSPQSVRMHSRIGSREAAHSTSVGKAILAHANKGTVQDVIAHGLEKRTSTTIATAAGLWKNLAEVRALGYAVDNSENEDHIRCIAAPIFDHAGRVASATSISGPASRVTPDRTQVLSAHVMAAANEMSRRLGARR